MNNLDFGFGLEANAWYHLSVSLVRGQSGSLYVNGHLFREVPLPSSMPPFQLPAASLGAWNQ